MVPSSPKPSITVPLRKYTLWLKNGQAGTPLDFVTGTSASGKRERYFSQSDTQVFGVYLVAAGPLAVQLVPCLGKAPNDCASTARIPVAEAGPPHRYLGRVSQPVLGLETGSATAELLRSSHQPLTQILHGRLSAVTPQRSGELTGSRHTSKYGHRHQLTCAEQDERLVMVAYPKKPA